MAILLGVSVLATWVFPCDASSIGTLVSKFELPYILPREFTRLSLAEELIHAKNVAYMMCINGTISSLNILRTLQKQDSTVNLLSMLYKCPYCTTIVVPPCPHHQGYIPDC